LVGSSFRRKPESILLGILFFSSFRRLRAPVARANGGAGPKGDQCLARSRFLRSQAKLPLSLRASG
jgi:hypothetical protein